RHLHSFPTRRSSDLTGGVKELLDAAQAKLGVTPNMMRTMAQSPAVLEAYGHRQDGWIERRRDSGGAQRFRQRRSNRRGIEIRQRSEEHTSELQSLTN